MFALSGNFPIKILSKSAVKIACLRTPLGSNDWERMRSPERNEENRREIWMEERVRSFFDNGILVFVTKEENK